MRQAWHIFRKDVHFLWPQILMVLGLTTVFGWSYAADRPVFAKGNSDLEDMRRIVAFFFLMSWWYLIGSAIHKEQPTGDRQFWVTRPYRWSSLVGAKLLLFCGTIAIPFLFSDIVILRAQGLAASAAGLAERQFELAAIFILPLAAFSAVAGRMAQIALYVTAAFTYVVWMDKLPGHSWGDLAWIRDSSLSMMVGIVALGALAWQYARRRTLISWVVLASAAAVGFLILSLDPPGVALAIESHFLSAPGTSAVHLSLIPNGYIDRDIPIRAHQFIRLSSAIGALAMRVDGLPPGTDAHADLADVQVTAPNMSWHSGWKPWAPPDSDPPPLIKWYEAPDGQTYVIVSRRILDRFQAQPVDVNLSLELTLYHAETPTPIAGGQSRTIPGLGRCSLVQRLPFKAVICRAAASPSVGVEIAQRLDLTPSFAPYHGIFQASPLLTFALEAPPNDLLVTERPIAHIQRTLQLKQLNLGRP